jgi:hypothetical protein
MLPARCYFIFYSNITRKKVKLLSAIYYLKYAGHLLSGASVAFLSENNVIPILTKSVRLFKSYTAGHKHGME